MEHRSESSEIIGGLVVSVLLLIVVGLGIGYLVATEKPDGQFRSTITPPTPIPVETGTVPLNEPIVLTITDGEITWEVYDAEPVCTSWNSQLGKRVRVPC